MIRNAPALERNFKFIQDDVTQPAGYASNLHTPDLEFPSDYLSFLRHLRIAQLFVNLGILRHRGDYRHQV